MTSPLHWKLVIDAHDPHAQADFWAAVLGHEVEDHSTLIGNLLDLGAIPPEILIDHHDRRAWRDAAAVRHPDDPSGCRPGSSRAYARRRPFPSGSVGRPARGRASGAAVAQMATSGFSTSG
jgi:Glyoxalase-like domain